MAPGAIVPSKEGQQVYKASHQGQGGEQKWGQLDRKALCTRMLCNSDMPALSVLHRVQADEAAREEVAASKLIHANANANK